MKKLLILLLLPLSSTLLADRHIEGVALKGTPGSFCYARPSRSIPKETVQKNLENAGFSNDFIQESALADFVSSEKKPCALEIVIQARSQIQRYNKEHGTELDSKKLTTALFAHDAKLNECLKLFEQIDKDIKSIFGNSEDAADPVSPVNIQSLSTGPGWFGNLGGFDSKE